MYFTETISTFVKRLVIGFDWDLNKEAKILIDLASYCATTHTNDAQTVHTCQIRSVCKPRPPAYIQARLVFKARPLLAQWHQTPGLYSRPGLYLRPGFYSRKYGILDVVTCAIIACNALQFLHAIIAGFRTCWKIFIRPKCCSQWQRLVELRDLHVT